MSNYAMDVDVAKVGCPVPKMDEVKKELLISMNELYARGLKTSCQWSSDLLLSLEIGNNPKPLAKKIEGYKRPKITRSLLTPVPKRMPVAKSTDLYSIDQLPIPYKEMELYLFARACYNAKEYQRASFWLKDCCSKIPLFLKMYSDYLAADSHIKNIGSEATPSMFREYRDLLDYLSQQLESIRQKKKGDGYLTYLLGVVYVKLEQYEAAVNMLVESINEVPLNWHAWMQLGDLIVDRVKLSKLELPNHWMKNFFYCQKYLDLQLNEQMLGMTQYLFNCGFSDSIFLQSKVAVCYHNKRYIEIAVQKFQELIEIEPCRLENMDTYSNLLYVQHQRVELAYLAQRAVKIDKYRVETCCILGNYYSLHGEHQKAMRYFHRALKLNPLYLAAWTLLGQEYMELKNSNDAIQSYSKALEINKYEYRAWYGLGQTYEILGMFKHSLYFFKQAQLLRPFDSRMIIAVGNVYEKLGNIDMAFQSYLKGRAMGDDEKLGLIYLAKLYVLINRPNDAAKMFLEYIEEHGLDEQTRDHSYAYMFLANYNLNRMNYDQAFHYAQKCLNYAETKEEAKALLKTIVHERVHMEVDNVLCTPMNEEKQSKDKDYDKEEMPRQLELLSLTQKHEINQNEDDEDDSSDEEEHLCNKITMYMDLVE
ncbi:cell division cycle protein 23 homolog [Melanaphis sacchari]|uniref:cell division cycle protein 23 homolog n=1 Tax=Melanaphis sacchari TaxID=742174 RepID=UPI000DC14DA5|nr:cell division cycle protein 23 homolog [Melanaphis sacchari]